MCAPLWQTAPGVAASQPAPEQRAFWQSTWAALERVDRAERRGTAWRRRVRALSAIAAERELDGRAHSDEQEMVRARILSWHVQRLEGRKPRAVPAPRGAVAWLDEEPWLAARALAPSDARADAMVRSLRAEAAALDAARAELAAQHVAEDLALAGYDRAARVAEGLDERGPTCATARRRIACDIRRGRTDLAEALARERLTACADPREEAALTVDLARALLARGAASEARRALGAALAAGSGEAAAVLAALELDAGRAERALALARAWFDDRDAPGVTPAQWGIALLTLGGAPPTGAVSLP